ncbi:TPA: hypothetical protein ACVO0H_004550 [Vibrio diabolicus]
MKIEKMPEEILSAVRKYGLHMPKMCYMNCFGLFVQTLTNDNFDIKYVLVDIDDGKGNSLPHAIIESKGCFYDPTLEPQGLIDQTNYTLVKQFSTEEIISLMQAQFTNEQIAKMCQGVEPFWPLQKVGENKYAFVDDGSPTIILETEPEPEPEPEVLLVEPPKAGWFGSIRRFMGF